MTHVTLFRGVALEPDAAARSPFMNYRFAFQKYAYMPVRMEEDGQERTVMCCAASPIAPGSKVLGVLLCESQGVLLGLCLPEEYLVFLEKYRTLTEAFIEYESYQYNNFVFSGEVNGFWPACGMPPRLDAHCRETSAQFFPSTLVRMTETREKPGVNSRYHALLTAPVGGEAVPFPAEIDHPAARGQSVVWMWYVSEKDGRAHPFAFAPCFAPFLLSLNRETERPLAAAFAHSGLLGVAGLILRMTQGHQALLQPGAVLRAMHTDPERGIARALSLGHTGRAYWTEFPCAAASPTEPGTLLEARVISLEGEYRLEPLAPLTLEELRPASVQAPAPAKPSSSAGDETLVKKSGDLLTVRESEKYLRHVRRQKDSAQGPHGEGDTQRTKHFSSARFNMAVEQGKLGSLHFEFLEWIGFLKYTTGQHLFRLVLCGLIPRHPQELDEKQQAWLEEVRPLHRMPDEMTDIELQKLNAIRDSAQEGIITLMEGDACRQIRYDKRPNSNLVKSFVQDRLEEHGLIDVASFTNGQEHYPPTQVLLLTEFGYKLLKAQRRRGSTFDNFAYMREIRVIKEILSGNQLMLAFYESLHKAHTILQEEIQIDPYVSVSTEDENEPNIIARLAFKMTVRKKGDEATKLHIYGESIRNTVGRAKAFDERGIREKMPRLLHVANWNAVQSSCPIVLAYVFASYEEMCERSRAIQADLDALTGRSPHLHVLYAYDQALMGEKSNSFFLWDAAQGKPMLVDDVSRLFAEKYL